MDRQARRNAQSRAGQDVRPSQTIDTEAQAALKRIPWSEIGESGRAKIKGVVSAYSIYRQMPKQTVYSDPEIFSYLLEHPDIVVGIWEKLGATQVSLRQLNENRYLMKESVGTTAVIEVLHRSTNLYIVYAKGQYKGPLLSRTYDGDSVLILRNRFARDSHGEPYVVSELDVFVRIESLGADLLAKLFASSLGKIADSNFEQTVAFASHVSEASCRNPGAVLRVGSDLPRVRPEIRDEFGEVVQRTAFRAIQREEKAREAFWAVQAEMQPAYASSYEYTPEYVPYPPAPEVDPIEELRAQVKVYDIPTLGEGAQRPSLDASVESRRRSDYFAMPTPPMRPATASAPSAFPEPVEVAPTPTLSPEPAKPTGRVIFGTPKIVRSADE